MPTAATAKARPRRCNPLVRILAVPLVRFLAALCRDGTLPILRDERLARGMADAGQRHPPYRERDARLKDFRRIDTRYDKLARNFLAGAMIAATLLWWIN